MDVMELLLPNPAATHRLGQVLGRSLPVGTILLLDGNLGSGKTSLVQGIGHGLGISEPIVSPTFTLVNEYLDGRLPLYHFDLYRLDTQAVASLYIDLYWEGVEYPLGLVAIEWPDRLPQWPEPALHIQLSITHDDQRLATLMPVGPVLPTWFKSLQGLMAAG